MSKRRRASELITGRSHGFKYPVAIVGVTSGTGANATAKGVLTVVAGASVATQCYITLSSGTNIGTLIGTASGNF